MTEKLSVMCSNPLRDLIVDEYPLPSSGAPPLYSDTTLQIAHLVQRVPSARSDLLVDGLLMGNVIHADCPNAAVTNCCRAYNLSSTLHASMLSSQSKPGRLLLWFPCSYTGRPLCSHERSLVAGSLDFKLDVDVSVFETNVRMLGGLLSAHLLAADPNLGLYGSIDGDKCDNAPHGRGIKCANGTSSEPNGMDYRDSGAASGQEPVEEVYRDELLALAEDLGRRLLPAFDTPTGDNRRIALRKISKGHRIRKPVSMTPFLLNSYYSIARLGRRQVQSDRGIR